MEAVEAVVAELQLQLTKVLQSALVVAVAVVEEPKQTPWLGLELAVVAVVVEVRRADACLGKLHTVPKYANLFKSSTNFSYLWQWSRRGISAVRRWWRRRTSRSNSVRLYTSRWRRRHRRCCVRDTDRCRCRERRFVLTSRSPKNSFSEQEPTFSLTDSMTESVVAAGREEASEQRSVTDRGCRPTRTCRSYPRWIFLRTSYQPHSSCCFQVQPPSIYFLSPRPYRHRRQCLRIRYPDSSRHGPCAWKVKSEVTKFWWAYWKFVGFEMSSFFIFSFLSFFLLLFLNQLDPLLVASGINSVLFSDIFLTPK